MSQEKNKIPNNLPPAVQHALKLNAEKENPSGPRLAYTGNAKLDELIAGIEGNNYEEVQLPSKGKFYEDGFAPNGMINVRCMTGQEEQILATGRHIKQGKAINMILKNCIKESINPEKLLAIDRSWLIIYLRGISYTSMYEVEIRCPECFNKFEHNVDLDTDIKVTKCPDDFGVENLYDVLPKSGYKFSYRLPTGKDEALIQDHADKSSKKGEDTTDDTLSFRASLLIEEIEGLTDKSALQVLLSRLSIQDVAYIRTLMNDPPFGVNTKIEVFCPKCLEEFGVLMPMNHANFFFPRAKKEKKIQA